MNNKKSLIFKVVSLLLAALWLAFLFTAYNTDLGVFENKAVKLICDISAAAVAIFGMIFCAIGHKTGQADGRVIRERGFSERITDFAVCSFAVFSSVELIISNVGKIKVLAVISLVFAVLAFCGAVMSLLKKKKGMLTAFLSAGKILWVVCVILAVYFTVDRAINDPIRNASMLCIGGLMLFALAETELRFDVCTEKTKAVCFGVSYACFGVAFSAFMYGIVKTVMAGSVLNHYETGMFAAAIFSSVLAWSDNERTVSAPTDGDIGDSSFSDPGYDCSENTASSVSNGDETAK